MTNLDALKEVYAALGGKDAIPDGATSACVISMIAQAIASGGGQLPPVSADDDGKILGVVDGAWAAIEHKAPGSTLEADDSAST